MAKQKIKKKRKRKRRSGNSIILKNLMRSEASLPILRVYTLIDSVQLHIDDVGQDFDCLEGGSSFIDEMHFSSVVPAEQELVDFLTKREITISQLYDLPFVAKHVASVRMRKHFPLAFEAQRKLAQFARRVGAPWILKQFHVGDFYTLCYLAAEYGDVASETLDDMWRQDKWPDYFQNNVDYIVTLPIFRAIESLRERLTMEEWGKRRKLFFGESHDELRRRDLDDDDDGENDKPWVP